MMTFAPANYDRFKLVSYAYLIYIYSVGSIHHAHVVALVMMLMLMRS